MSDSSKIRIGVIGCGHWGPNHVRVFSQLPGSEVTACADPEERRRNAVRSQFPTVNTYPSHQELLARAPVDAVVIASPTRFHFEGVRDALLADKHVLCEKPLCLVAAEAAELIALAAQRKRILMVGHVFLFNGGIRKLKDLIRAPGAGRIYSLRATRMNLGPIRSDVNCVYDLATHDLAIFNWLLDAAPESVSAVGGCFLQQKIEDVAFISLRYPDNIVANVQVSWLDPKKLREIVVVTEKKMVAWDDLASPGPVTIYDKGIDRPPDYQDFGQFQLITRDGDLTIPKVALQEPLKVQNSFFLEAIHTGQLSFNDGAFTMGVLHTLEAIAGSLKQGGAAVPVAK